MAHSLSAKKRARQNEKARTTNRARKSVVKTQIKKFEMALSAGDVDTAKQEFQAVVKRLDKTAATSTMHKRTAARKKSRLAKRLNALAGDKG
ncbi:30S ribosomal protein S20 [Planctomycetota bacterium]